MHSTHTTRRLALIAIPFVLAGLAAGLHALAPPPQNGGHRIAAPGGFDVKWAEIDVADRDWICALLTPLYRWLYRWDRH